MSRLEEAGELRCLHQDSQAFVHRPDATLKLLPLRQLVITRGAARNFSDVSLTSEKM
jgi:hypothetical protein